MRKFKRNELLEFHKKYLETKNERYIEAILDRFEPFLNSYSRKFTNDFFEREDLIQEGRLAIWLALQKNYREESHLVVNIINSVRNSIRKAFKPTKYFTIEEYYQEDNSYNFEELLYIHSFIDSLKEKLTERQKIILDMVYRGYSFTDIAKIFKVSIVAINESFMAVRKKAKRLKNSRNLKFNYI